MKTIVVSAFEAFGNDAINPTMILLEALSDHNKPYRIIKVVLPVVYDLCYVELMKLINQQNQVDGVIMLGLAAHRKDVQIEMVSVNMDNSPNPDNQGEIRNFLRIISTGDDAYFTTLPVEKILENTKKNNLPVSLSYSAGTYVCNNLFYRMMHTVSKSPIFTPAGFIHIPYLEDKVKDLGIPSLSLNSMVESIEAIIDLII